MIAIDMPIPNNCDECPCEHDAACYADGWRNPEMCRYDHRPEDCPLIDLTDDGK